MPHGISVIRVASSLDRSQRKISSGTKVTSLAEGEPTSQVATSSKWPKKGVDNQANRNNNNQLKPAGAVGWRNRIRFKQRR